MAVVALGIFVVAYLLIATERINKVKAALGGAAVVVAIGIVGSDDIFYSRETGIDWDVIFLLLGMMVIVGVLRQTGVFEYTAIWAAKRAKGSPLRVMILLALITAAASALLDNVTTVLLIAPVTLLVCDRLAINPVPFLLAEVFASNIGGTATLIGDPPNIIIGSRAGLSFNDFLVHVTPLVVIALAAFLALLPWLFRGSFTVESDRVAEVMSLNERGDSRCAPTRQVRGGVGCGLRRVHRTLGDPRRAGGGGTARRWCPDRRLRCRADALPGQRRMGDAVVLCRPVHPRRGTGEDRGDRPGSRVRRCSHRRQSAVGCDGDPVGVGAAVGVIDNIPYVATMSPVVADLAATVANPVHGQALWWSLAIGADFGGNLTAVGASANVVMLGIAAREGTISFWEFTRKGAIVTASTIGVAAPYVWLRYFVFG